MKSTTPPAVHALRTSRSGRAKCLSVFMLLASPCLMQERLFGQEAVAANEPAQAASTSISGKWRTGGTFSVSVAGNKVIGGDGPTWVTFKKSGGMTTEMDFPFRWGVSGGKLKLYLDKKRTAAQLGTPTLIHYRRNSLTRSGSRITGNFDCSFNARGVTVRWVWKFTGRN